MGHHLSLLFAGWDARLLADALLRSGVAVACQLQDSADVLCLWLEGLMKLNLRLRKRYLSLSWKLVIFMILGSYFDHLPFFTMPPQVTHSPFFSFFNFSAQTLEP